MRHINILMVGIHYFNKQIQEIALPSDEWHVTHFNYSQHSNRFTKLWALMKQLFKADIFYQSFVRMSTRDLVGWYIAVIFRKPVILHWIGTDILSASKRIKHKNKLPRILRYAHHWATAPWFLSELEQIGINAEFVRFTGKKRKLYLSIEPPSFPEKFTVLSYVPDERPEFYGWEIIKKLAEEFGDIDFNIIRGTGKATPNTPPNIHFHGWVDDTLNAYTNSTLIIRPTKHDGLTGTVQEALALGRHVIWTYPFPGVIQANDYTTIREKVGQLFELHKQHLLKPNIEGRHFVSEFFNPDDIATQFADKLRQVIS